MLQMRMALWVVLFVFSACLRVAGQNVEVSGTKIALPEGSVVGAVIYDAKEMFFVQQIVHSIENQVDILPLLSSWDIKSHSMIAKRELGVVPRVPRRYPCGRVEVSGKSHQVLTCSAESFLEIIDPENLSTIGKLAYRNDQFIEDFVVDDLRSRVLVLSSRRDGTIRLTAYSMPEGRQQQEAVLPFVHGYTMGLALASETGQVGVSVDSAGRSSSKADIYVCGSVASFDCANLAPQIDSVYQISFLGRQLLAASNHPTFNKKDCILAIDLDT